MIQGFKFWIAPHSFLSKLDRKNWWHSSRPKLLYHCAKGSSNCDAWQINQTHLELGASRVLCLAILLEDCHYPTFHKNPIKPYNAVLKAKVSLLQFLDLHGFTCLMDSQFARWVIFYQSEWLQVCLFFRCMFWKHPGIVDRSPLEKSSEIPSSEIPSKISDTMHANGTRHCLRFIARLRAPAFSAFLNPQHCEPWRLHAWGIGNESPRCEAA